MLPCCVDNEPGGAEGHLLKEMFNLHSTMELVEELEFNISSGTTPYGYAQSSSATCPRRPSKLPSSGRCSYNEWPAGFPRLFGLDHPGCWAYASVQAMGWYSTHTMSRHRHTQPAGIL